jgi:hypothetical protein
MIYHNLMKIKKSNFNAKEHDFHLKDLFLHHAKFEIILSTNLIPIVFIWSPAISIKSHFARNLI